MRIEPFAMERFQSLWENVVEYNLSESGVHPLRLSELLSQDELRQLVQTPLGYSQTNGSLELRAVVASMYEGASVENVLVTTGSSEANFLSILHLVENDDEVALMLPNYMQIWGVSRAFGANVKPFHLVPMKDRWQLDWEEFESVVSKRTKLIAVCNPNNPTGAQLGECEIDRICDVASRADAWILSDEVYRGAERIGDTTPSFWGRYDKVIVVCGLSKAYGLPGLRIGWVVASPELVDKLWSYHDYTTICPSPLSDRLARIALTSPKREEIINRTRRIVRNNFDILNRWIAEHDGMLSCIPPIAGAIALVNYNLRIKSLELVTRLREEKSVLVVPGEQFMMEHYLRFGFGSSSTFLEEALRRISEFLGSLSV